MGKIAEIRTFICFEVPSDILEKLENLQLRLRPYGPTVKWTRPEGIHLTLKFLGDVEEDKIEAIANALKVVGQEFEPISLRVSGTGVFPGYRKPRVFWVGVQDPTGQLENLQKRIETELVALGYPQSEKRYSPHLTIGRLKKLRDLTELLKEFKASSMDMGEFTAKEIVVMKSNLFQTGAIYTPLHKIKLK